MSLGIYANNFFLRCRILNTNDANARGTNKILQNTNTNTNTNIDYKLCQHHRDTNKILQNIPVVNTYGGKHHDHILRNILKHLTIFHCTDDLKQIEQSPATNLVADCVEMIQSKSCKFLCKKIQFLPHAHFRCPPFLKFHTTRKSKFHFTLLLVILDESTLILHEKMWLCWENKYQLFSEDWPGKLFESAHGDLD